MLKLDDFDRIDSCPQRINVQISNHQKEIGRSRIRKKRENDHQNALLDRPIASKT